MCVRDGGLSSPLLKWGTTKVMRTDSVVSILCFGRLSGFPEEQYSWDGAMRTTFVGFRSDLWALLPSCPLARWGQGWSSPGSHPGEVADPCSPLWMLTTLILVGMSRARPARANTGQAVG